MHPYQPILEAPRRDMYNGLAHGNLYDDFNVNLEGLAVEEEDDKPRRRTSVACIRCRKRKIRCSGDPGDNTGCTACKSARKDPKECEFRRVGSESLQVIAHHLNGSKKTLSTSASFDYGHKHTQPVYHRPSLPNMSAHIARSAEYGEAPSRHDSFGYFSEDYYPQKSYRAPSVAENRMSMTSLQDTLPPQARHLPMPQQLLKPQTPAYHWRPQGGIHDRGSMSWAPDQVKSDFKHISYDKKEPEFGYHITHTAPSPKISPKTQSEATDFGAMTLKPIQQVPASQPVPALQTVQPAVPCYIPSGPVAGSQSTSYYAPTAVMNTTSHQPVSYFMPPPPPPQRQVYISPVIPHQPKPFTYRHYPHSHQHSHASTSLQQSSVGQLPQPSSTSQHTFAGQPPQPSSTPQQTFLEQPPQLSSTSQQTYTGQLSRSSSAVQQPFARQLYYPQYITSPYMLEPVGLQRQNSSTYMLEPANLRRHSASTYEAGLDLCNFSTAATEHNIMNNQRSPRTLDVPFNSPGHIYAPQAQRNDVAESLQRQASFELQKQTLDGVEAAAQ